MGITNSFSALFKQVNTLLNKHEDEKEALDYSYTRQVTQVYRRSSNSQRLEKQKMKLCYNIRILDEQARCAIESNREVLAKKTVKTVKQKTDEQEEPVVVE